MGEVTAYQNLKANLLDRWQAASSKWRKGSIDPVENVAAGIEMLREGIQKDFGVDEETAGKIAIGTVWTQLKDLEQGPKVIVE